MKILKKLLEIEHKFAWSIVSVILAFIFGIFTVYIGLLYEKKPRITFDIYANASVLDVKEEIPNLKIIYDDIDIKQKNETLILIAVRIINDGSKPILKTYYDENEPLGLFLNEGRIIKHELIEASNDYLINNTKMTLTSEKRLLFSSVIFEPKDYFAIKLLVLHKKSDLPGITPVGKVANIPKINIKESYSRERTKTSSSGDLKIGIVEHVLKVIVYGISFVSILMLFFGVGVAIILIFGRQKRQKIVNDFKNYSNISLTKQDEYIFRSYIKYRFYFIKHLTILMLREDLIPSIYSIVEESSLFRNPIKVGNERNDDIFIHEISPRGVTKKALEMGFVKKKDDSFLVDQHSKVTLQRFLIYLKERNHLSLSEFNIEEFKVFLNSLQNNYQIGTNK